MKSNAKTRSDAALRAWKTRRLSLPPPERAKIAEAASKEALRLYSKRNGWQVAFFESPSGSPRTGIIDAIMFQLGRRNPDALDIRLVQLKGGKAGTSAQEIKRLKRSADIAAVKWLIAEHDGDALHFTADWTDNA